MSTIPVNTFSGISSFSQDLQSALNRAIAIASLPIKQLSADKNRFDAQAAELGKIGNLFTNLQSVLQSLSSGSGSNVLAVTTSNDAVLKANLTGSAFPGTYALQVLDPGSNSNALSGAGPTPVTDPSTQSISSSTSFTLTVGGATYTIQPGTQSLNALAQSINASGAPAQATIINLGSPSQPDYRLAIQSTNLGDVPLQLNDGTSDLLTGTTTGSNALYTVNGQPPGGISSNSRTVTIAPGLNVTLQAAGSTNVTVAQSVDAISTALTAFAHAYNAVVAEIDTNRGQTGGPLTGDSSLISMQESLRRLVNFTGASGGVTSLTQLGVEFTQQGILTFDPSKLAGLSQADIGQAVTFLGDSLSGGFLKAANDELNLLVDPISGLVSGELQSIEKQSQQQSNAIADAQDRVNLLAANLTAQMAAADALIATLQQRTQFIAGLFNIPKLNANGTFSNNQ